MVGGIVADEVDVVVGGRLVVEVLGVVVVDGKVDVVFGKVTDGVIVGGLVFKVVVAVCGEVAEIILTMVVDKVLQLQVVFVGRVVVVGGVAVGVLVVGRVVVCESIGNEIFVVDSGEAVIVCDVIVVSESFVVCEVDVVCEILVVVVARECCMLYVCPVVSSETTFRFLLFRAKLDIVVVVVVVSE